MEQQKKLKIFILEDSPLRIQNFSDMFITDDMIISNSATTAISLLCNIKFDIIFLDHDLGGSVMVDVKDTNTGSEVCKHINAINKDSQVIIHSWNPHGAVTMKHTLKGKGFTNVIEQRFNEMLAISVKGHYTK